MDLKDSFLELQYFTGNYSATIDDRNRLNLPKKFFQSISKTNDLEKNFELYLRVRKSKNECCIDIFPKNKFQELSHKIRQLPDNKIRVRAYKRTFFGSVEKVILDKRHRFLLDEKSLKTLGLFEEKNVVFVGLGDYIQLFKASTYANIQKSEELNADDIENEINLNE